MSGVYTTGPRDLYSSPTTLIPPEPVLAPHQANYAQRSARSFESTSNSGTPPTASSASLATAATASPPPYPKPDPFVEALRHTVSLQQLCLQCRNAKDGDQQRILYLGQLVTALTQLLRKARELDALDKEEEYEQLKDLQTNVKKIRTMSQDITAAAAHRQFIWNRAHHLLVDIQNRLAEEHVATGLKDVVKAIGEVELSLRSRSSR